MPGSLFNAPEEAVEELTVPNKESNYGYDSQVIVKAPTGSNSAIYAEVIITVMLLGLIGLAVFLGVKCYAYYKGPTKLQTFLNSPPTLQTY